MPKDDRARTRAARERMSRQPGLNYTQALAAVDAERSSEATGVDPVLLAPYPDEDGMTAEELGWRALPADATPQQRAHAEAVWRPVLPERPCRCSGPCRHGGTCGCEYEDGTCDGRLIHADRYPGSMWGLTVWEDVYECASCDATASGTAELPGVPWGELRDPEPGSTIRPTIVYSGVRHPAFPEIPDGAPEHPDGDGACRGCGGYALSGFLCDGCRADGWTDYYGVVEEPDPFDDADDCDCGAAASGNPYAECVC